MIRAFSWLQIAKFEFEQAFLQLFRQWADGLRYQATLPLINMLEVTDVFLEHVHVLRPVLLISSAKL